MLASPHVAAVQPSEEDDDVVLDLSSKLSFALARNAKSLCSMVFVVGRDVDEALHSADLQRWTFLDWFDWQDIEVTVDEQAQTVTLAADPAPPRTAAFNGDQGCTILREGQERVFFEPVEVPYQGPDPSERWPTGDATDGEIPSEVDQQAVEAALDAAFSDEGERAMVVVYDGQIIGERYAPGFDVNTRHLSFSMGKSITAALIGILVEDGHLDVNEPAPVDEWRDARDPRSAITISHLMRMSSGLDCEDLPATHEDHFTWANDHHMVYNEGIDVFSFAVDRGLVRAPGTEWAYHNCDNLSLGKIIRDTVEEVGEYDYLTFPQRALFDRIGMRSMVLEPDPYGNFVLSGHNYGTARDWARFGLLHLQDGVWDGERILPEGWIDYITAPAPARADGGYGAQWWLSPEGSETLPADAYWASGAEGQTAMVLPSHDMVIARLGWDPGTDFETVVRDLIAAVDRAPTVG